MDTKEIIQKCQKGDWSSFEELYRMYARKTLGIAYLIAGNKGIAEDIVQEAFSICFKEIKKIRDPGTFDTWFYRILVRVGWRMAAKHNNNVSIDEIAENTEKTPQMGDIVDAECNRLIIRKAVKRLPVQYKTVIILYYFNELSIRDISTVLGCYQGTVKSRLFKARKILQRELGGAFKEEFPHFIYQNGEGLNG